MTRGSPLLLTIWLREHFRLVDTPVEYSPYTLHRRRLLVKGLSVDEWASLFAKAETNDIEWCPPFWRVKRFVANTPGYDRVVLPGLRDSSFYFARRVMRQFSQQQDTFVLGGRSQDVVLMDPELATSLARDWGQGSSVDRWTNLRHEGGSIYLSDKYLDWFLAELRPNMDGIDEIRRTLLGDQVEPSLSLRRKEAKGDPSNISADATQDFLDSDFYEKRANGLPGKLQALDRPHVFSRLTRSVFDRLDVPPGFEIPRYKRKKDDTTDRGQAPTKSRKK